MVLREACFSMTAFWPAFTPGSARRACSAALAVRVASAKSTRGSGMSASALTDIQCPIYGIGTVRDHVAPWRSVHKLHLLTHVDTTFLLTSGGHNVGIVNPPGLQGRSYQVLTRRHDGAYLDPEAWLQAAVHQEGSWWPHWLAWLQTYSGEPGPLPVMGAPDMGLSPLADAPGQYVLQK